MMININGDKMASAKSLKYLGIRVDSNLSFNKQADTIATKASKIIS